MSLAGFFGVIYGPVIMIVFVTTIELYRTYFLGIGEPEDVNYEVILSTE
jgi:predicted PurR-regulated permease PerM